MQKIEVFEEIFKKADHLPTLPGIAIKILQEFQKKDPDIDEIGKILSTDPPLCAKVLRIVNSSFYSLATKITSLNHAIKLLGINSVKNMALSFSLVSKFNSKKATAMSHSRFWKDALVGAIAAKLIGEKILKPFSEDLFFLGLLQDIGIFTLNYAVPKQYDLVMAEQPEEGRHTHEVESRILGFTHMEVGQYLTRSWNLPESFHTPIGFHHQPEKLNDTREDIHTLTKILHLSSLYIDLFKSAEVRLKLAEIDHCVKGYGFDSVVDPHEIGQCINNQASEIFPFFEIDLKDENDYAVLLETARDELLKLSRELVNDLLSQRQENTLLKEQVGRDSMTDLHNHQSFKDLLRQEIARAERYGNDLSILFADIDHFKSINDTHGHPAGDSVIKAIAACLKNKLRESDHVARYGGEEFAIILPETKKGDALDVAERLRKSIQSLEIHHEDSTMHATMSFGVASVELGVNTSVDKAIEMADTALYQAKKQGRNRCAVF